MTVESRARVRTAAWLGAAGLGIGLFVWFTAGSLQPLVYEGRPVEYLFLGASPYLLAGAALAAGLALWGGHRRLLRSVAVERTSPQVTGYLVPLALLGVAPLAAIVLLPGSGPALSVLTYVLVDLRLWWYAALVVTALVRLDRVRGWPLWIRARRVLVRPTAPGRLFLLDASLWALLLAWAVLSAPHLRFTPILHGDEPKYLRYCENLYQGLGLDVSRQQPLNELTLAYVPPIWRNASLFARAVRQDTAFLVEDTRRFLAEGTAFRWNRGTFVEGWFLHGRNGGFYQVHNPGFSFVLAPAYFLDRHFFATSGGYQGVFPTSLPVTNLLCLFIWSIWGVVLFRLLRLCTGRDGLSWLLAVAGMLTMPVSAFAFQIYPETLAGLTVTLVFIWLVFKSPDGSRAAIALAAGAAVGFLPWLHVRFMLLSIVLAAWALATLRRRRVPFAVAYAALTCALCLYAYHLTGSFRPDAMYETEGGAAPWLLRDALQSMASYPFDRIWGFLPHAPVYLLALPGWVLGFRRWPRATVLAGLLIASLVIPASGHGFTAAGATPLRHLVAVVPLAMIPLAATLLASAERRWVRVAFVVLLVLSLDAATSYNLHHRKETGRMIDEAVSGWAPNLLFPWTHAQPWAHWTGTFVLFLLWVAACVGLLIAPLLLRGRPARAIGGLSLGQMVAGTIAFVVLGTCATALGGEWVRADYFVPLPEARARSIDFVSGLDKCRLCYSSARGEVGRGDVVLDADQTFELEAMNPEVRAGEEVVFRVTAFARDGEGWGTLSLDFGDDDTARMELRGREEVRHVYRTPGERRATARFVSHGAPPQHRHATIAVRDAVVDVANVTGAPDALRRAPRRGAISIVALGPEGLRVRLAGDPAAPSAWLLVWDGRAWQLAPPQIAPGTWVAVIAGPADGSARTNPVVVRWPNPAVTVGAEVVLYTEP